MPPQHGVETAADGPLPPRRLSITITARSIWLGAAVVVGILLAMLIVSKALSTLVLLLLAIILGEEAPSLATCQITSTSCGTGCLTCRGSCKPRRG